jgi:hypothetical protein
MNSSTFYYVEFEPFTDAGHRVHTANHYADKLRSRSAFERYCVVAPPSNLDFKVLKQALRGYDLVDLSLARMLTPADEQTNIAHVGSLLTAALKNSEIKYSDSNMVYTHMPSPFALMALYVSIRALAEDSDAKPKVLVRLCMIDEEWAWYKIRLSKLIRMIRSDPVCGQLFEFTTESEGLSKYYSDHCGFNPRIQFNPFPEAELALTRNKHRNHNALYGNMISFAFLGEAREEKGFQHLPRLVDTLRASGVNFSFLIHAFSNLSNNTALIQEARAGLTARAEGQRDLKVINYPVPDTIYSSHQRRADVIVMPYSKISYRIRGSGVAFEAIRSNCYMLVTTDLDLGATFSESNRVIEYEPDFPSVDVLKLLAEKVFSERSARYIGDHPAVRYKDKFFESAISSIGVANSDCASSSHHHGFQDLASILGYCPSLQDMVDALKARELDLA